MIRLHAIASPLALLLAFVITVPADAAAPAKANDSARSAVSRPHLTATLIADVDAVKPGSTFRLGVHYKMDPKWHIYWIEPGEAGVPTKVNFDLPDGWAGEAIQWPAPTDFTTGDIKGVGYVDETVLFTTVRVPESAKEGEVVRIAAKTSWLVCEDSCIRGRATLSLDLTVNALNERSKAVLGRLCRHAPIVGDSARQAASRRGSIGSSVVNRCLISWNFSWTRW